MIDPSNETDELHDAAGDTITVLRHQMLDVVIETGDGSFPTCSLAAASSSSRVAVKHLIASRNTRATENSDRSSETANQHDCAKTDPNPY